jgi:hypothetical protein
VQRAVLPRVLTLAQVELVIKNTPVEIEVFGFGSLCVMNEGRCWLSSYATGESPNTVGACSPAKYVKWDKKPGQMETRLNGILIDRYKRRRAGRLPDAVQGALRGQRRDLLRARRADQPQRARNPAGDRRSASRDQGRGPPAQPGLRAQVTRTLRAALDELADG